MIQYVLPTIVPELRDLVHQLVLGDYAHLEQAGLVAELSAMTVERIAQVVADYGETLVDIPDEAFATAEAYGSSGISFSLWTVEEGRSGLTLYVHVTGETNPAVQIERLHGFPPKLIPPLQGLIHQLVIGNYAGLA